MPIDLSNLKNLSVFTIEQTNGNANEITDIPQSFGLGFGNNQVQVLLSFTNRKFELKNLLSFLSKVIAQRVEVLCSEVVYVDDSSIQFDSAVSVYHDGRWIDNSQQTNPFSHLENICEFELKEYKRINKPNIYSHALFYEGENSQVEIWCNTVSFKL